MGRTLKVDDDRDTPTTGENFPVNDGKILNDCERAHEEKNRQPSSTSPGMINRQRMRTPRKTMNRKTSSPTFHVFSPSSFVSVVSLLAVILVLESLSFASFAEAQWKLLSDDQGGISSPPIRQGSAGAYCGGTMDLFVIYSGFSSRSNNDFTDDVWTWSFALGKWQSLNVTTAPIRPQPRVWHTLAELPMLAPDWCRLLMFGGTNRDSTMSFKE